MEPKLFYLRPSLGKNNEQVTKWLDRYGRLNVLIDFWSETRRTKLISSIFEDFFESMSSEESDFLAPWKNIERGNSDYPGKESLLWPYQLDQVKPPDQTWFIEAS